MSGTLPRSQQPFDIYCPDFTGMETKAQTLCPEPSISRASFGEGVQAAKSPWSSWFQGWDGTELEAVSALGLSPHSLSHQRWTQDPRACPLPPRASCENQLSAWDSAWCGLRRCQAMPHALAGLPPSLLGDLKHTRKPWWALLCRAPLREGPTKGCPTKVWPAQ